MCKNKHAIKGSLLHFVAFAAAVFVSTLISGNAFAATTTANGIYTDPNTDIRWEYELVTDSENQVEPQVLTIRFYDKPIGETTVKVPSLSNLVSGISGATNDLDTYFLKDADVAAQDTTYGSANPRRAPEVDTTVLDMTDTSKIQILGVKPIINPEVETELVFGSNMVIGDGIGKRVGYKGYCRTLTQQSDGSYSCRVELNDWRYIEDFEEKLPGWSNMTEAQRATYNANLQDVATAANCGIIPASNGTTLPASMYDASKSCWLAEGRIGSDYIKTYDTYSSLAFAGYKLKLTNFEQNSFNYVGWKAFKDSTFNEVNTTITIEDNSPFVGGDTFRNTNVKRIIINTNDYGVGLFRDCQGIENISFGEKATYLQNDTFAGTSLTSISFANTNVKRIGARAFEGAQLTTVDFTGIERIDYRAFKDNDIAEIYLPKSINYLQSSLFTNNMNLKKVTVAYDTLSSGTTLPFWVVYGGPDVCSGINCDLPLEEVNVIAPYTTDEPVSATHVTYDDYRWGFNTWNQEHTGGSQPNYWGMNSYGYKYGQTYLFEDDFADYDNYKNILAPLYFATFRNLKKITIGEGYEYIGSSAFWYNYFLGITWPTNQALDGTFNGQIDSDKRYLETIQLPETLKGVGNLAFQGSYAVNMQVNLPKSLEFIGVSAFQELYHMTGDFDLPNLKYLGDFAFNGTSLRDITIHDTLEYWGVKAFINAPFIRNITIDCDIFSPDKYVPWATRDRSLSYDSNANPGLENFRMEFGYYTGTGFSGNSWSGAGTEDIDRWGIKERSYLGQSAWSHFGKITFTDKVVHMMEIMGQGSDTTSSSDSFFGQTSADEIDMSAMSWKILPRKFFNRIYVKKISLPENLEVIAHHAFVNTQLEEELIIPDSVKIIGAHAFEQAELYAHTENCHYDSSLGYTVCEEDLLPTIKITKLPSSLEYVGYDAFWGDINMTADLNAPNLKYVGSHAFMNTGIRDVLIPNGLTMLREGAFAANKNLRNITIDTNLNEIYTTAAERHGPDSYVFPSYFVEWAGDIEKAKVEIDSKALVSNCSYFDQRMASGYFDTHPEAMQYQSAECVDDQPLELFYTIFNKQMEYDSAKYKYFVKETQLELGDTYGTLTFGSHATNDLTPGNNGFFAGLTFEKVDLSQAGWTKLTTRDSAFYRSKIGTLILPSTLESINYAAFELAEVTNPITLPTSLRTIDTSAFQWAKIGGLDIKEGLEETGYSSFLWSEIGGEFTLPNSLKTIGNNTFMEAKGSITNMIPDSVETVGGAAFYQSDMSDELVIPASVTQIGWSAFSTTVENVHYDKVTIKTDLTSSMNSGQLVHQMLWHIDLDELVIESNTLVGIERYANSANNQEFYNLPMDKVTITNLPMITYGAFDKCSNLVEVDLSKDANLRDIKTEAFLDAEKLHIIKFSPALKNETVNVGQRAFVNTAFETMTDATSEFDLTAAHFNASENGLSFTEMPKLKKLAIPNGFSNNTVPVATFMNDPELEEVTIGYRITHIKDAAFYNDTKIKKVFIWGNTIVQDSNLTGYEAPNYYGQGADDDEEPGGGSAAAINPDILTIPGQADIYAYSVSPTEAYAANSRERQESEGEFYPLDEVLYLTSNKPTVLLNDDETDFDKSDLVVYGLRRDGVVLESDEWAQYDGVFYVRSAKPLTFEKMAATIAEDPDFGTIYDTPVPLNELNLGNENFSQIDFAIVPAQDDPAVRIVNIVYTDGYTGGEPDTDIDPRQEQEPEPEPVTPEDPEEPETPETPKTQDELGKYIALFTGSVAAGLGLIGWNLIRRNRR